MALSFVGGSAANAVNGGDPSGSLPGTIAQDDVVYAILCLSVDDAVADITMAMTTSDYVKLADLHDDGNIADCNTGIFRKIMGATPDSTIVGTGSGDATSGAALAWHVWRGADTTTPEDATTTTDTTSDEDSPAITTNTAGAVVLTLASNANGDSAIDAPTGYSNQVNDQANDTFDATVGIASKSIASPTTEDPGQWGSWLTGGVNRGSCNATVAIKPAGTGATTQTVTASLDAYLQKTITKTASIDALLQKNLTSTASLDSLLRKNAITIAASLDSILAKLYTVTASLDAHLKKTVAATASIDALLEKQGVTKTASLDALLVKQQSLTTALDALLRGTATRTVSLDSLLQKAQSLTASIDAYLQKNETLDTSIDALLQKAVTATANLDAYLQKAVTISTSLDAILLAEGTNTRTVSLDALLRKNAIQLSVSLDAHIQNTAETTVDLDALLKATETLTVSLDAILQGAFIGHPIRRRRSYTGWRRWLEAEKAPPTPRKIAEYRLLMDSANLERRIAQADMRAREIDLMERVTERLGHMLDVAERIEREDEDDLELLLHTIH